MKTSATLTLNVTYEGEDAYERNCRQLLEDLVSFAANRGLLSGDLDMVVDAYTYRVTTEECSDESEDNDE